MVGWRGGRVHWLMRLWLPEAPVAAESVCGCWGIRNEEGRSEEGRDGGEGATY